MQVLEYVRNHLEGVKTGQISKEDEIEIPFEQLSSRWRQAGGSGEACGTSRTKLCLAVMRKMLQALTLIVPTSWYWNWSFYVNS
jgi:hypothetical protein